MAGAVSCEWLLRHALALFLLPLAVFFSGCANPVIVAYDATYVMGPSRQAFSANDKFYLQFPYRGGYVTYEPKSGSYWSRMPPDRSRKQLLDTSKEVKSTDMIVNGCLISACERAEIIRRGGLPGATRAQVIGYQRLQDAGHSIVVYNLRGQTIAEDKRHRVVVSPWTERTPAQALRIAREFTRGSFSIPTSAVFYGDY